MVSQTLVRWCRVAGKTPWAGVMAAVAILGFCLPATAQSDKPANDRPPMGWTEIAAEQLLRDAYLSKTRSRPAIVPPAKQLMDQYAARVDQWRQSNKAQLTAHTDARTALRKLRLSDPGVRDQWTAWSARDRELFAPLRDLITEYEGQLTQLASEAQPPPPTAADPATAATNSVTAVGPTSPPATGQPSLPVVSANPGQLNDLDWATGEFVAAQLDNLPVIPTVLVEGFQTRADTFRAGRNLDEKLLGRLERLVRDYARSYERVRDRRLTEIATLSDMVALVRTYPSSIRVGDVKALRAHWLEVVESQSRWSSSFDEELRKLTN